MRLCLFFKILTDHRVVNIRLSIHQKSELWSLKCMKFVFRPGFRPGPRWGAHDAPQPPNRLGRGKPPPHSLPPRRLRRLGLVAPANWGRCLHPSGGDGRP